MNTPRKPEDITQSPSDDAHINATHTNVAEVLEDPFQLKQREALAKQLGAEFVGAFHCDRAYAKKNGRYFFVDREGNRINDLEYDYVRNFKENRAVVGRLIEPGKNTNHWGEPHGNVYKYSYVDLNGNPINDEEYDRANDFSEELASVGVHSEDVTEHEVDMNGIMGKRCVKCHYVTPDGERAFGDKTFLGAQDFSEGLAAVGRDLKYASYSGGEEDDNDDISFLHGDTSYIDKTGEVSIKGPFYGGGEFKNGYAEVGEYIDTGCKQIDGSKIIDREGNTVIDGMLNSPHYYVKLEGDDEPCKYVTCDKLEEYEYAAYLMDPEGLSVVNFMEWYHNQPHLMNRPGETRSDIPEPQFPQVFGIYTLNNAQDAHDLNEKIIEKINELRTAFTIKQIEEEFDVYEDGEFDPFIDCLFGQAIDYISYVDKETSYIVGHNWALKSFLDWHEDNNKKTFPQTFDGYELKDLEAANALYARIESMFKKLSDTYSYKHQKNPAYSMERFKKEMEKLGLALGEFMRADYNFDECEFPMPCSYHYNLRDTITLHSKNEAEALHKRLKDNPDDLVAVATEYLKKDDEFNLYTASEDFHFSDELPYHLFEERMGNNGRIGKKWHCNTVFRNGDLFSEGLMPIQKEKNGKWFYVDEKGQRVGSQSFRSRPGRFNCGVAIIGSYKAYRLIDRSTEYVTDLVFDDIDEFENDGVARAKLNGEIVYIDTRGNVIF